MKKIAITTGDPAGIGPEIASKTIRFLPTKKDICYVVYGKLNPAIDGNDVIKIDTIESANNCEHIYWIEVDNYGVIQGEASENSGKAAYEILEKVAKDLNDKKLDAVVTCPISKKAIHFTHPEFIGHTEFFAQSSSNPDVIMSFWGQHFNLALLTTHMPVQNVPSFLTREVLEKKFKLIYSEAKRLLGAPKVAMLAINPHAGEDGAFGNEDIIIRELLDDLAKEDILIDGPFPADTFFSRKATDYDLIISAFHDQGLIPFKMLTADEGVNVTLGLPYIRTSVDHGTAFDIAGKDIASETSLESAIKFAESLLNPQQGTEFINYSIFAKHYDKYMQQVNYPRWTKLILDRYSETYKHEPEKILELACGTANIASLLTEQGFQVDASDLAPEMLKIAAKKKYVPNLYYANMLDEIKTGKYELILLLFDSLNYLSSIEEVSTLLTNTHKALQKNGMFIFDITTIKNSIDNFDGFVNLEDSIDQYIIHQSDLDKESNIQTTELTFFTKKGFNFSRADEIHKQTIFSIKKLKEVIKASKLKLVGIYSSDSSTNLLKRRSSVLENDYSRLFMVLTN
ncbi:MAG: 4-hydroxythreonine-4-phosphate dehydrogenase PdxA [Candidatus Cloacimonetes bacterium]|nr:4-hydroxythreonine-4-phosphate dehydrogenase PdxA [Candidatus Cloacimonadota bacterium]